MNGSPFPPSAPAARGAPTTLPTRVIPLWTVQSVRAALFAHEQGLFQQSAVLADHIMRDSEIRGALDTLTLAMVGLPMTMEKALEGDQRRAQSVADECAGWYSKRFRKRLIRRFCSWRVLMGIAPGETTWAERDGRWLPSLKFWHPQHLRWLEAVKQYQMNTLDQGVVRFTPGDGNWVLFGGTEWDERPWMEGLIRSLAIPWMIKVAALNNFGRAVEVYGLGVRKAKVPAKAKPEIVKRFFKQVKNLGAEPVIRLPDGFDVEVAMVEAQKGEGFQALIAYCDKCATTVIAGNSMTTHGTSGSYKQTEAGTNKELDRIEALAEDWSDFFQEQIGGPWAERNVGDAELSPRPAYDPAPPADKAKRASTLQTASMGIATLRKAQIITVNEGRKILGDVLEDDYPDLEDGDQSPLEEDEDPKGLDETMQQSQQLQQQQQQKGPENPPKPPPDPDQDRTPPPPG